MSSPSEDQDRERWRGRVEAFMETHTSRVNAAFEMLEVMRERLDDKVDRIEKDLHKLSQELSNFSAKATVIIAIGAFLGTAATSLLVTAIIKVLMK